MRRGVDHGRILCVASDSSGEVVPSRLVNDPMAVRAIILLVSAIS